MNSIFALIIVALLAAIVILIPILIGVYVYHDAKKRGMDAVLWALVAVLVPSFVGLIIYLIIRSNNPNRDCPNCKKPVSDEYALCPYCGVPLKETCPSCQASVDRSWKLCPKCGEELPELSESEDSPAKPKKDRKLLGIILAAVFMPIVIFVLGVLGIGYLRFDNKAVVGSMSLRTNLVTRVDLADLDIINNVADWTAACDAKGKGVYVLKLDDYAARNQLSLDPYYSGEINVFYVYINTYADEYNKDIDYKRHYKASAPLLSPFGNTIEISYETTTDSASELFPTYELSEITTQDYNIGGLTIYVDGKKADYELTLLSDMLAHN
ncbi:MAG: zinc ribbon domain-containing protein [Oscillospiraceae bacterium]|jgi:RNA polymerase subunit RPABC4/transcription elongation factor Spt4|nr:zinc ribbon domain-containing protein [Oscillospiraceae bacterium]